MQESMGLQKQSTVMFYLSLIFRSYILEENMVITVYVFFITCF